MVIPLQNDLVYGPVASRRLGASLGVNPLPTSFKLCSFDCVYCQYGRTPKAPDFYSKKVFPSPGAVAKRLEEKLRECCARGVGVDYVTFSGNGEPTLNPNFPKLVTLVDKIRRTLVPDLKIAVLSNSTTVNISDVCEALRKVDERIMKLDAGDEKLLQAINRPMVKTTLEEIVSGLKKIGKVTIQTLFIAGSYSNSTDQAVTRWIEKLLEIHPEKIQIYTLARPTAEKGVLPVEKNTLLKIASRVETETGFSAQVYPSR